MAPSSTWTRPSSSRSRSVGTFPVSPFPFSAKRKPVAAYKAATGRLFSGLFYVAAIRRKSPRSRLSVRNLPCAPENGKAWGVGSGTIRCDPNIRLHRQVPLPTPPRSLACSPCPTSWPPAPKWRCPSHSTRSEEHTSELQSRLHLVCRLLLEKKKKHET